MTARYCNGLKQLRMRDMRGSKLRCLLLTGLPQDRFLDVINELVSPCAIVDRKPNAAKWMPRGICDPGEAQLDKAEAFLTPSRREELRKWWLGSMTSKRTPNWDIACSCKIEDRDGLVLVEAKAHKSEVREKDEGVRVEPLKEANLGLPLDFGVWSLNHTTHYQLSNRFAWAWKLADLGTPVVLVYLGCLNATEMLDRGDPFHSAEEWEAWVRSYGRWTVPDGVWGQRLEVNGTPLFPLIRSLDLHFQIL